MFQIKQLIKMLLQNILLPLLYKMYSRRPVEEGLVLFADAHHSEMPFSMSRMYEAVCALEEPYVETFITDFDRISFLAMAKYLIHFMQRYAVAEYVFICDYFLPVSSCDKRPETMVVQLWHACGMLKKIAYEAKDDIPKGYRGNMFGNYTYMTVSAGACIAPHERAMRLAPGRTFATGISRTDFYFDEAWNAKCREHFYAEHPEAQGRRIILWAPTFRGNAANPRLEGLEEVRRIVGRQAGGAYLIIKAHPHIDRHEKVSNCEIPTEELLPVADLLITDYSSILFDWLLYRKPMILYTPDLPEYEAARGFFMDFRSIPFPIAQTEEELVMAMEKMDIRADKDTNSVKNVNGVKNVKDASKKETGKTEADFQIEKGMSGKAETDFPIEKGMSGKGETDFPIEKAALGKDWMSTHAAEISQFMDLCVGACDGHATERILQLVGLS
ncbi:MAG: CDP-glycerol glycerophosphotransferase family protein [Lachnospiraceae bacterium]|nr:CDP-glycerol glycerophosphotransferase family protein [Lachnospiraceae bacterium]